jgi:hypothetical protein
MASARALSVWTCRPGISWVRSTISTWARLLNATTVRASAGAEERSRWRARSVSTRVFPDPAGAMMRARTSESATASSWSLARSASRALVESGTSEPASMASNGTTTASSSSSSRVQRRRVPPSHHASRPSGRRTSARSPGAAPRAMARSASSQAGVPPRRSTELRVSSAQDVSATKSWSTAVSNTSVARTAAIGGCSPCSSS